MNVPAKGPVRGSPGPLYAWFFGPQSLYPLALLRINLGLILFFCYLFYLPELPELFGPEAITHYYLGGGWWESVPESTYLAIYALILVSSLSFSVGFQTRISGLLLIFGHHFYYQMSTLFVWGWGYVINAFLLYVIFSRGGALYSIDAWLKRRKYPAIEEETEDVGWPYRLVQIHACVIYMAAAWHRIDDPGWWRGELTFEALNSTLFGRFTSVDWIEYKKFLEFGTVVTLLLELAAPVLIWISSLRIWIVGLLMLFHLTLEITTTTGWWQYMMVSALFLFLPPGVSKAVLDRLTRPAALFRQRAAKE